MADAPDSQFAERLRSVPLFSSLSPASLARVSGIVTEFEVAAGHVLVQPGEAGAGMFVLEEGVVTIELQGRSLEAGPGEFFGELALLAPVARTGRVRASTPVRCLAIGREDFSRLLEEEPSIAVAMLPVLARRLVDANG